MSKGGTRTSILGTRKSEKPNEERAPSDESRVVVRRYFLCLTAGFPYNTALVQSTPERVNTSVKS